MALALFSGTTYQSPVTATGAVNSGGKVWFYEPGTSTLKNAYTTSALDVATSNPLTLDSTGRGTAWLNGAYYIRVFDSAGNLIDEEDNYNKGSSFDITAVTAARTMVGVDDTGSFTHSGTYTASLTQASTLGAGWFTDHYNIGTGVITFARLAAGDTIDGTAANFTLQPGEFVRVTVNSGTTGFVTVITKRDLYATAAGTDTYTCTFAPAISALYDGQKMRVKFTNANATTTPTLDANGLGAKTIKKEGGAALVAGDIPAGHEAELTYNGTDFIVGNPSYAASQSRGVTLRGAYVYSSAAQSIATGTSTIMNFGSEDHDTASFHDNATNNTRLTIPAGVTYIRLTGGASFAAHDIGRRHIYIFKNGAGLAPQLAVLVQATNSTTFATILNIASPNLSVVAGDYFELGVTQGSGVALDVTAWFGIEVVAN